MRGEIRSKANKYCWHGRFGPSGRDTMKPIYSNATFVVASLIIAGCLGPRYAALQKRVDEELVGSAFTHTHIERYSDGKLHLSVGSSDVTNITDLRALEAIPYAELGIDVLDIQGWNFATDFSPLSGLQLKGLGIGGSLYLTNTAFLSGMCLEDLDLTQCIELSDLTPLRGLPLVSLKIEDTKVSDLTPLKGMKLEELDIQNTDVTNLTPLVGMPLRDLDISFSKVTDLSPIAGMPLEELDISLTSVHDLRPLRGMPLRELILHGTKVTDLTPLSGMAITRLYLAGTAVTNLFALTGMPLTLLHLDDTYIKDFSPLHGAPLKWLCCLYKDDVDLSTLHGLPLEMLYIRPVTSESSLNDLRAIATLRSINNQSPQAFWRAYDNGTLGKPSVITYAGGNGLSPDTAVVIQGAASSADIVAAERRWIRENHPNWEMGDQALLTERGRKYDRIEYMSPNGEKTTLYFDITSGFGGSDM